VPGTPLTQEGFNSKSGCFFRVPVDRCIDLVAAKQSQEVASVHRCFLRGRSHVAPVFCKNLGKVFFFECLRPFLFQYRVA